MNILNKTDGKLWKGHNHEKSRMEYHGWPAVEGEGDFSWVEKALLNIDGTYQREAVSSKKVLDIAEGFDWKLFGTLSVIRRADSSLWIYDGGHRCRAAFMRDDVDRLPCMVFESTDKKEEAQAFVGTNTMKSAVAIFYRHRAALLAGDPVAVFAQSLIEKNGLTAGEGTGTSGVFFAIAQLHRMIESDKIMAQKVFDLCASIPGDPPPASVLGAVFNLENKLEGSTIFNPRCEQVIRNCGIDGLVAAINREKLIQGKGGAGVAAKAVLDILNKGCRKKMTFKQ